MHSLGRRWPIHVQGWAIGLSQVCIFFTSNTCRTHGGDSWGLHVDGEAVQVGAGGAAGAGDKLAISVEGGGALVGRAAVQ